MRKIITCLILLIIPLLLMGCTSPPTEVADGYQFGDITRFNQHELSKLSAQRAVYCSDTSSSALKQIAIDLIRTKLPLYPADGICTDAFTALLNTVANTDKPDANARASP